MKNEYLFLGFLIPESEMKKEFYRDPHPAIQTHNFHWKIVKAIEEKSKEYESIFYYISSRQISEFPLHPEKKISSHTWSVSIKDKLIIIKELGFINKSFLKIITRFYNSLFEGYKQLKRIKNKKAIIVYSVHVPYMLTGVILAKIFKIDLIGIWTDPPSVDIEYDNSIKRKFRKFEYYVSIKLMSRYTKVIALTKHLAIDFAPKKPYIVIEGISDEINFSHSESKEDIQSPFDSEYINIVYTGTLAKKYGIANIVSAFEMLPFSSKMKLHIFGKGDYEDEIMKISYNNNRIIYHGLLNNRDIKNIQVSADYLINARSSIDSYTKYSFPSKLIEYFESGTPVISTFLPGMPSEYKKYIIELCNNDASVIAEKLIQIEKSNQKRYKILGLSAKKFVQNKDYINQGIEILKFIIR